jgi:hypothetical protein
MHCTVVPTQDPIWSNLCRLPGRLREAPRRTWRRAGSAHPRDGSRPAAGWGSGCHDALVEPGTHDASRRTYLAEERTLLAWVAFGTGGFRRLRRRRPPPAGAARRGWPRTVRRPRLGVRAPRARARALRLAPRAGAGESAGGGWLRPPSRGSSPRSPRTWPRSGSPRSPSSCPSERWLRPSPQRTSDPMIGSSLLEALTEVVPIEGPEDRSGR